MEPSRPHPCAYTLSYAATGLSPATFGGDLFARTRPLFVLMTAAPEKESTYNRFNSSTEETVKVLKLIRSWIAIRDFDRQMKVARAIMARDRDLCAKLKDTPDHDDTIESRTDQETGK
jgi:hypothetical protein